MSLRAEVERVLEVYRTSPNTPKTREPILEVLSRIISNYIQKNVKVSIVPVSQGCIQPIVSVDIEKIRTDLNGLSEIFN